MSLPSSWRRPLVISSTVIVLVFCFFYVKKNCLLSLRSDARIEKSHLTDSTSGSLSSAEESNRRGAKSQELPTKSSDRNNNGAKNPTLATDRPTVSKTLAYAAPVAQSGQKIEAEVTIGNEKLKLSPNQLGVFQRVNIPLSAKVPISLFYPEGNEGDPVVIESEDGGTITEGQKPVFVGKIPADKHLAFQFEATDQQGLFRVSLRQGADVKQLEFWAGSPLPYAASNDQ